MSRWLDSLQKTVLRGALKLPRPAMLALSGGRQKVIRGRRLDPQLQISCKLASQAPGMETTTPVKARHIMRMFAEAYEGNAPAMARVEDTCLPGPGGDIPVRIYTPVISGQSPDEPLPGIVFFHGGGYVVGDLETHDGICRRLAQGSRARVIAVDYRLAPEHPFPAPVEDCYAAWLWVNRQADALGLDRERLAVAGDSAGGNLATVVSLKARDEQQPIPALQVLIYPCTDLHGNTRSMEEFGEGFVLTRKLIQWFYGHYFGQDLAVRENPYGSPLLADHLEGLPPAIMTLAGFDPLCDEGEAYAQRLQEAGVPVTTLFHEHLIHGYITMGGKIDAARQAIAELNLEIRNAFYHDKQ